MNCLWWCCCSACLQAWACWRRWNMTYWRRWNTTRPASWNRRWNPNVEVDDDLHVRRPGRGNSISDIECHDDRHDSQLKARTTVQQVSMIDLLQMN